MPSDKIRHLAKLSARDGAERLMYLYNLSNKVNMKL